MLTLIVRYIHEGGDAKFQGHGTPTTHSEKF